MERIIYKYMQTEKIRKNYGTDIQITQVEIHTIEVIGDHSGINITELAAIRGITKGAASQVVYKLVDKGLVKKSFSETSDVERSLTLTPLGNQAYEGHRKYHESTNEEIFEFLREMPVDAYDGLVHALSKFENFLDERILKK